MHQLKDILFANYMAVQIRYSDDGQTHDESLCTTLIQLLNRTTCIDRDLMMHFVRTFLLESNSISIRWQAHSLIHQIYKNRKTKKYLDRAIDLLKDENQILANHPNAQIYNMLQGLVDFDGYYLESGPCLVLHKPEAVKHQGTSDEYILQQQDSTSCSGTVKQTRTLAQGQKDDTYCRSDRYQVACNLMIEYADFYDNLQATSETLQCPHCSASIPANPGVCGNCGKVCSGVINAGKISQPLVFSHRFIHFQAINYDEKDPFLCNACGFCKYAKFDFTPTAKPCCAVDPIENEEDRKKAITIINLLLEKADRIFKQLQLHRPALENLGIQVAEHSTGRPEDGDGQGGGVPGSAVNKSIQQLALKYWGESKSSFDELSKIIQKVLACRKELVDYERQQRQAVATSSSPVTSPRDPPVLKQPVKKAEKFSGKPSHCFGSASAAVEHCITLIRALVTNTNLRHILCSQGMIQELIDFNMRQATLHVRSLLCLLTKDNRRGTGKMNNIIMTHISAAVKGHLSNPDLGSSVRHEILLLANSLKQEDTCWEFRVRCVMRLFLMGMSECS
ncbi:E3 ubiquitin-protein ligase UBR4-like [Mercenaria mercenaria]|uniref:E3 ubiquitin-protein ligase UBR4-like n=1 Tax=Mercenaria mercenaria TaxID=6596 RepID=UPI00234F3FCA|nr:E3 ubiquitin-protein ligase UBR4-like [Mercenaria mercenaria]